MYRSGMSTIISTLRSYANASQSDYTLVGSGGTVTYFSDQQLQDILDRNRETFVYENIEAQKPYLIAGGSHEWKVYNIDRQNIEQGTGVFYIQDSSGAVVDASEYTVDYHNGIVTFDENTEGKPYYATGASYDVYGAAADVWTMKANNVSNSFDFSTDNHNIKRSQVYAQYMQQAEYYRGLSKSGSGGSGMMTREDTVAISF